MFINSVYIIIRVFELLFFILAPISQQVLLWHTKFDASV